MPLNIVQRELVDCLAAFWGHVCSIDKGIRRVYGGKQGNITFLDGLSTSTRNSLQKAMQWLFRSSTDEATCSCNPDWHVCYSVSI